MPRHVLEPNAEIGAQGHGKPRLHSILFGSRARGTQRRSSDIDIGFSGLDEKTFLRTRDRLLAELEESTIPHRVDLANMDATTPEFKIIAMQEAIEQP